jgi:pSer/pThr/pTyr-binding forkhead associated (FHA) protein
MVNGQKITAGEKKVLHDGDIIELTKAKITCSIESDKLVSSELNEHTQAIAARAVQGILGRMGDSENEGPYFRVLAGPTEGERLTLAGASAEWALGRANDCEFPLPDAKVSRRHALVKKDWSGFTIEDLGSRNGVIVNDRKLSKPRRLRDRDEIVIGPVKLLFIDPDAELMAALKDVPGFDLDEPEELDEEPSHVGAPQDGEDDDGEPESSEDGEVFDDGEDEGEQEDVGPEVAPVEEHGEESESQELDGLEDLAAIDPDLLSDTGARSGSEWLVIGAVVVVMAVAVILLLALLT